MNLGISRPPGRVVYEALIMPSLLLIFNDLRYSFLSILLLLTTTRLLLCVLSLLHTYFMRLIKTKEKMNTIQTLSISICFSLYALCAFLPILIICLCRAKQQLKQLPYETVFPPQARHLRSLNE